MNQAMKLGQLIKYNVRNTFLQISCRKVDYFQTSFYFLKTLDKVKQVVDTLALIYFGGLRLGHAIKKTL